MERKIITTADGSHSIAIPDLKVTYHSVHGAIQESKHVFIEAGLSYAVENLIIPVFKIFEMGLGTGLNALFTAIEAEKNGTKIHYTAIEQFPITVAEAMFLNYPSVLGHANLFQTIQNSKWNEPIVINEYFTLKKIDTDLLNFSSSQNFHLVYYDAFAPNAQPELWTKEIFEKLFFMLEPGGSLITYCSKGDVRRALSASGFSVKNCPGHRAKEKYLEQPDLKKDSN